MTSTPDQSSELPDPDVTSGSDSIASDTVDADLADTDSTDPEAPVDDPADTAAPGSRASESATDATAPGSGDAGPDLTADDPGSEVPDVADHGPLDRAQQAIDEAREASREALRDPSPGATSSAPAEDLAEQRGDDSAT